MIKNEQVKKINASTTGQVWVISGNNDRVYKIENNFIKYDITQLLNSYTNSTFTAIASISENEALIGTKNDFLFHYSNGIITKLDDYYGITDSTVSSVVNSGLASIQIGAYKKAFFSDTNFLYYSDTNFLNSTFFNSNNLDSIRFYEPNTDDGYKMLFSYYDVSRGGYSAQTVTPSTIFDFGTFWGIPNINAAYTYDLFGNGTRTAWYIGTDSGMYMYVYSYGEALNSLKINDIQIYKGNMILATDSGLYIQTDIYSFTQLNIGFSGFKAFDLEVYDKYLIVASDTGLIWLSDTMICEDFQLNFDMHTDTLNLAFESQLKLLACECYIDYLWNFGDGEVSNLQNPIHTYNSSGEYNICLTATNDCGVNTTVCDSVSVICPVPHSSFGHLDSLLTVKFCDSSTYATSWFWDFGEGFRDTVQYPTFIFDSSGSYNVCLITFNACGTDTNCKSITVSNTGINENILITNLLKVYPNPFNISATIELNSGLKMTMLELKIYHLLGKEIRKEEIINTRKIIIDRKDLAMGLYFFKILDKNKVIGIGKFIIE